MLPLVSVIIPTYRRNQTLKNALLSICKQDYPYIEIIVVDDNACSEWNRQVSQIVQEMKSSLPASHTLCLITNPDNLGAARSRNAGIHAASGAFITFLDDDDLYLASKVSVQTTAMLEAHADYSLMDLDLFTDKGQLVEHKTHPGLSSHCSRDELIRLHLREHLTGTDTFMFRREYLLQIGCFGNIDIGDEFYLMMKAIEHGGQFLYLPKALVHACVHCDGSGLSCGPGKFEGENQLFQFKRQYFNRLCHKDVCYIRMRHHAVLAFAHWRLKHYKSFLLQAALSVLSAPVACLQMLYKRKK